ncbi:MULTISPECIES: Coenzyme F420 hydrogenase/dehydrogenase, beta subunit C-terminal domain [Enterobacterales]|jgi:coenzyme F420 hydrogenase subunit beta|uniref:Coenzyme F420 hydrogenase/dehydrogenase, beta subunit C-terminal domain n=1 Tax=Morganella morganii TaxID=582 RepID=A0AAE4JQW8_MORMO|nr:MULTISPECIES: Coenzyme F420 hydrogenase/dehydrogenase, beta subunit C-terminal domain [Enterobacterales]ELZ3154813.1 Coenzyme F420 hydrogenase/dehydrogenase, beta subunit C-terminal domain [Klebsiella pneumoniae]EFB7153454.1 4Fe-4S ferredoxin [Escherichia coli]EFH9210188.1 4Fe-4S ferredoxin [Escherichia coli]EJL9600272.1 Coenzyme F420 hydrogenase/dehydrogenase, beta subunit C-terminal domain [Escherichia coli]ELO5125246.1 Coenzyme F420 hydrogenase/dehydrogenase, beta subunit C-terminal doma
MNGNSMIKAVVENDMCIGCGMCAAQSKTNAIQMKINQFGFYVANVSETDTDTYNDDCIKVCPFNPNPDDKVKTENEIADLFLKQASNHHNKIGRYINTYAGYSIEHRLNSSSGGIATYTLTELMRRGEIQHVISVKAGPNTAHYQYTISSTIDELASAAKTKYYPVTLADTLKDINKLDGKVAIVGVACFIKAIRLAQVHDPIFNAKIGFLIGIICGGVKSAFFAEYLSSKAGVAADEFKQPEFRIKDHDSTASDYSFGCLDKNNIHQTIKMRMVGDMWGTGLFKANACDYCDDVTTELADLSVGDAWLEPYVQDGRGHNVLVTRSALADDIIKSGITNGALVIEELAECRFLASQQGSYNHRHDGLAYRIKHGRIDKDAIPIKRFDTKLRSPLLMLIQSMRMNSRRKSLEIWQSEKSSSSFDNKMKKHLFWLKLFTRLNHYQRAILRRINKAI